MCFKVGETDSMSFLERQRALAEEQWKSGQDIKSSSEAAEGGTEYDYDSEYDGYDYEYYEEEEEEEGEPELLKPPPKPEPKRKQKGFKKTEAVGFLDIVRPFNYPSMIGEAGKFLKCDSAYGPTGKPKPSAPKDKPVITDRTTNTVAVPEIESIDAGSAVPKRLSLKEKQDLRKKEREQQAQIEKEKEKAKLDIPPKKMGAPCESSLCAACKSVVDEFGQRVFRAINDPEVEYVYDLSDSFCATKEIASKYGPFMEFICKAIFADEATGHRGVLVRRFEQTTDWDKVSSPANLYRHQKEFCMEAGLCFSEHFSFSLEPVRPEQEGWSEKCFVCRAIASEVEARSSLYSNLKDSTALVQQVCDYLMLPGTSDSVCRDWLGAGALDEISWLLKIHHDNTLKQLIATEEFAQSLCVEAKACPRIEEKKSDTVEIEAPFW